MRLNSLIYEVTFDLGNSSNVCAAFSVEYGARFGSVDSTRQV